MDSLMHAAYRSLVAPFGRRSLQRSLRRGLPEAFGPALGVVIGGSPDHEAREVAGRVEKLREAVASRSELFEVEFAAGPNKTRTATDIAYGSSVDRQWGLFLYLSAREFKAATILELGSCAGISGCYLASAPSCRRFVSIEASPTLAALAGDNVRQIFPAAEVHNGFVEDVLPQILSTLETPIDLVYIDTRHELDATLNYWEQLRPRLTDGALAVFDDIRWSPGMWKAWNMIRREAGLGCTVDTGRFGLCLCDRKAAVAAHYSFAKYAGWWRVLRHK